MTRSVYIFYHSNFTPNETKLVKRPFELFLESDSESNKRWHRRSFYRKELAFFVFASCMQNLFKRTRTKEYRKKCPFVSSLVNEFFRHPLSLLQLSRMKIRRSIGMFDFERRVKFLQLPPLLLSYVWRANEILSTTS